MNEIKYIHSYDSNGYYTGTEVAQHNPKRPGEYLLPPDVTFVELPEPLPDKIRKFNGETWIYVTDLSHKIFYVKETGEQKKLDIGEEPDDTLTEIAPKPNQVWVDNAWGYTRGFLELAYLNKINNECDATLNQMKQSYPDSEVRTWDRQEAEARAFIADSNSTTPLIDNLSTSREIDKTELANRIVAKANMWATVAGQIIGARQKLEDNIENMTDEELEIAVFGKSGDSQQAP